MRLYALSIAAQRKNEPEQIEIAIQTALSLLSDEAEIGPEGFGMAQRLFPPSDGWEQHAVHVMEVVQGLPFGPGHHLEWTVKENEEEK